MLVYTLLYFHKTSLLNTKLLVKHVFNLQNSPQMNDKNLSLLMGLCLSIKSLKELNIKRLNMKNVRIVGDAGKKSRYEFDPVGCACFITQKHKLLIH